MERARHHRNSIALAFLFGYALTVRPLLASGLALRAAAKLAFAADTLSIAIMEIVDNAIMLAIPGPMDAGLGEPLFWGSLALALVVAGVVAFPVNRWLIARGQGHAVVTPTTEGITTRFRLFGPCLSSVNRQIYPLAGVVAEWLKAPVC